MDCLYDDVVPCRENRQKGQQHDILCVKCQMSQLLGIGVVTFSILSLIIVCILLKNYIILQDIQVILVM